MGGAATWWGGGGKSNQGAFGTVEAAHHQTTLRHTILAPLGGPPVAVAQWGHKLPAVSKRQHNP